MRQVLFSSVIAVGFAGCASLGSLASTGEVEVVYGSDADENLKRGKEALEGKNYPEAQRYFEWVKTKYTYLEAAKEAELLLADNDFERERFLEARDRYLTFVRLHPTHPKIDYAAWRAALTHFKDIPSDFFLLPPTAEKDQVELRAALLAMNDFVRSYPESSYQAEAKKALDQVKQQLAEHELYVAQFYARRDRWPAVIGRYNTIVKSYPGIGYDERAYFGMYDAWRNLRDDAHARATLEEYVLKFPESDGAKRAKRVLETAAALPPPATPPPTAPAAPAPVPDAGS